MPNTKVDTDTGVRTAEWSKTERAVLYRAAALLEDEGTILDRNLDDGDKPTPEMEAAKDLALTLRGCGSEGVSPLPTNLPE